MHNIYNHITITYVTDYYTVCMCAILYTLYIIYICMYIDFEYDDRCRGTDLGKCIYV